MSKTEQPPEWFTDPITGRRVGVIENERLRRQWFIERGLPDPASDSAARVAGPWKEGERARTRHRVASAS